MFGLTKDQLTGFRTAVDADRTGERFAAAVAALTGAGWSTMGDTLVRVPRGFDPEHPRADLLRHRSFALTVDHGDPEWFVTAECLDRVVAGWRALNPVLAWLGDHVGPADPTD